MSKVDLKIILDEQQMDQESPFIREFTAGEWVRGQVQVIAHKNAHCKALKISLGWETSGSGNVARDSRENEKVLFQGDFTPEEQYSFPFELQIPEEGPCEFVGKELIVLYYLKATADIPMAFDPVSRLQIKVRPSSKSGLIYQAGQSTITPENLQATGELGAVLGTFLSLFIAFIASLFFYTILSAIFQGLQRMSVFLGIFLLFFALFYFLFFKNRFAQYKIEKPIFEMTTNVVHPGGKIPFGAAVTAKRPLNLNALQLTLTCTEITVSGSGSNRTTHRHEIFNIKQNYFENEALDPGIEKKVMDQISIPEETPFYFNAPDNSVVCKLEIRFDIASCPDYTLSKNIYVIPKGYRVQPSKEATISQDNLL